MDPIKVLSLVLALRAMDRGADPEQAVMIAETALATIDPYSPMLDSLIRIRNVVDLGMIP